jgi:Tol biopolymer transport system component
VKLVGAANAIRLTTDPADDLNPAFSPDGRWVGFIRQPKQKDKGHVNFMLVPSLGGPERTIADLPDSGSFAWFPDSKWVVTSGLTLLSTESGETRTLTSPPTGSFPDSGPAVSPDGRTVAFTRFLSFSVEQIYLLDLTEDLKLKGGPRQLTSSKDFSYEPAWTADGQEIIFVSGSFGNVGLWKIPASGRSEAEPLVFASGAAFEPAVSRKGNRLAYVQGPGAFDDDIWRLMLSGPGIAGGPPARFIASTRSDSAAQYSPDGKRIAFESDSGGVRSIWVCDAAGINIVELFSRAGAVCGTAHWLPDGQRIAFDSNLEGNFDIYVIRASGGKPIRLTNDPAATLPQVGQEMANGFTLNREGVAAWRFGRCRLEVERPFRSLGMGAGPLRSPPMAGRFTIPKETLKQRVFGRYRWRAARNVRYSRPCSGEASVSSAMGSTSYRSPIRPESLPSNF